MMSSNMFSGLLPLGKQRNIDDEWMSLAHGREVSLLALLSRSLYEETAFQLSSHLVHSTNNTHGQRVRFIQVPARIQVYANSFFNRTVKELTRQPETVMYATTTGGSDFNFLICFDTPHICVTFDLMVLANCLVDIDT